jgi:hypothetical protein
VSLLYTHTTPLSQLDLVASLAARAAGRVLLRPGGARVGGKRGRAAERPAAGAGSLGGEMAAALQGLVAARKSQVPPPRIKWTRRVPHPVLIGHAASLAPY